MSEAAPNPDEIANRYAEATAWRPIEPGSCALCGQKPEVRPKTVAEFCAWWRMSRDKFYELKARGSTPNLVKVGRRYLITREAEDEWCKKQSETTVDCKSI